MNEAQAKQIQAAQRALERASNITDMSEILRCLQNARLIIQNVEHNVYQNTPGVRQDV